MALVFVHGVATRRDPNYYRGVALRNALFRRYVYPALQWSIDVSPFNAYWGNDAAEFRWHHESLPQEDVETFGSTDFEDFLLAEATGGAEIDATAPVSSLSRRSVEDAADLVWAATAQNVNDEGDAEALADLAYRASVLMPTLQTDTALTQATDDHQWLSVLVERIGEAHQPEAKQEVEAFGGKASRARDRLHESLIRIRGAAGRHSSTAATNLLRARLHRHAAVFLGDVFTYLDRRGPREDPGSIVEAVANELDAATTVGGPLVVVAHSMGGQIVYDLLSYYRPDLHVNKLVTVGSQVGLFEELCLLQKGKEAGCPKWQTRVPRLDNVDDWINVFDRNDLLAFATERIFDGVQDFEYKTGRSLLAAHSTYFTMPSFFRQLAERLRA